MADDIGDRCKRFEAAEAGRRAMPGIPLLARLDGRAFHTFTRGLARPYDERMSRCMVETTRHLVDDLQAAIGYTQSDEITLLWFVPSGGPAEYPFDGRFQKIASVAAYVRRESVVRTFTEAERARIPEAHRPAPDATYVRSEVRPLELPPIRRVGNALAVLFDGVTPVER